MDNSVSNLQKNREEKLLHNRMGQLALAAAVVFIFLQVALVTYSMVTDFPTSAFPTRSNSPTSGTLRHVYANEGRELRLPIGAAQDVTIHVTSHTGSVDVYLLSSDAPEDSTLEDSTLEDSTLEDSTPKEPTLEDSSAAHQLEMKSESVVFTTTEDEQLLYFDFHKHSGNVEVVYS